MTQLKQFIYSLKTSGVEIDVRPEYMYDMSQPDENHFMWSYHVTIRNTRKDTIQLMTRYWKIIDETGHVVEVSGDGVIGVQPVLEPGEEFHYSSGTPLHTPSGMMMGHYTMHSTENEIFDVPIPSFSLDSTLEPQRVH